MAAASPAAIKKSELPAMFKPSPDVHYIDPRSPNFIIDESENGRGYPYTREELSEIIDSAVERHKSGLPAIIHPVTVRPFGKGKVKLSIGFGRALAIRTANEEGLTEQPMMLPYFVTQMNDTESFLSNLDENLRRRTTTPVDDALNVRRLRTQFQFTDDQIMKKYKRSRSWLSLTDSILTMEPDELTRLHREQTPADTVYVLAALDNYKQRQEVLKDATEQVVREAEADLPSSVPVDQAKAIIQEATAGKPIPIHRLEEEVIKKAVKKGVAKEAAKKVGRFAKKTAAPKPLKRHVVQAIAKVTGNDVRPRKTPEIRELCERLGGPGASSNKNQIRLFNAKADWITGENGMSTEKFEKLVAKIFPEVEEPEEPAAKNGAKAATKRAKTTRKR